MQITPRYEGPPLLRLEGDLTDPAVPLLRQRRRLGALLASLDEDRWAAPSRCAGWSVRDVVLHLTSTNRFFASSLAKGFAGDPTRYLVGFDPVATPAQLVDAQRDLSSEQVLATYRDGVEALAELVTDLDDDTWSRVAESPPGHVPARAVALHALWDAWIHERDIALPLGLPQPVELDELTECLRYCAGLGPALLSSAGDARPGRFAVHTREPDLRLVVELGPTVVVRDGEGPDPAFVVTGRAVDVVEALSYRRPHAPPLPAEHAWMLSGLGEVFDQA